jgi:hypothetical protein
MTIWAAVVEQWVAVTGAIAAAVAAAAAHQVMLIHWQPVLALTEHLQHTTPPTKHRYGQLKPSACAAHICNMTISLQILVIMHV